MTKTLWCNVSDDMWKPVYKKITAVKVEEIEERVENLYKDENGNYYEVQRNNFKRRMEFVKLDR